MSGFRYAITNSNGSFSSTFVDTDDVFVPYDMFLNANLETWGDGQQGGLGTGDTVNTSSPVQVGTLTNWKQVTMRLYNCAALKTDGTLWTWGQNSTNGPGQLGLGDTVNRSSPVQVGTLTDWKQLADGNASDRHACIKTDGTLWVWGADQQGGLGLGDTLARSSPTQVGTLTNWKQISMGAASVCVKTDGTLWTWGFNSNGELGLGYTSPLRQSSPIQVGSMTDWKSPSAGGGHTACIKTDGTLWIWGNNSNGELGLGDTIRRSSPVQVGSLTNWKQVSCGGDHTACIKTDGTLWTWGSNKSAGVTVYGQLGLGDVISRSSPVQVGSLTDWKQVNCGNFNTACIKTDGTLWTWGENVFAGSGGGMLGLGDSIRRSSPVQVGSFTYWKQVSASSYNMAAIVSDDLPI
jgi:alpha-tubulin suppressor-like RCC1 family protein